MKKAKKSPSREMRAEYDFSGGIRGKYAHRCAQGTNLVILEPDIAKVFQDSAAVNRSLRALITLLDEQQKILAAK